MQEDEVSKSQAELLPPKAPLSTWGGLRAGGLTRPFDLKEEEQETGR